MKREKTNPFSSALDESLQKISLLLERKKALSDELEKVDEELVNFEEAAISMGRLCDVDPKKERPELFPESAEPEKGLTDAIRAVLRNPIRPNRLFAPTMVRDRLRDSGFPLSKYKNPLASIHTVLKRLTEAGEIDRVVLDEVVLYDPKEKIK